MTTLQLRLLSGQVLPTGLGTYRERNESRECTRQKNHVAADSAFFNRTGPKAVFVKPHGSIRLRVLTRLRDTTEYCPVPPKKRLSCSMTYKP